MRQARLCHQHSQRSRHRQLRQTFLSSSLPLGCRRCKTGWQVAMRWCAWAFSCCLLVWRFWLNLPPMRVCSHRRCAWRVWRLLVHFCWVWAGVCGKNPGQMMRMRPAPQAPLGAWPMPTPCRARAWRCFTSVFSAPTAYMACSRRSGLLCCWLWCARRRRLWLCCKTRWLWLLSALRAAMRRRFCSRRAAMPSAVYWPITCC